MQLRLGTAGYAYPAWVGGFYPRGTAQHDMLPYYATQFAAVEINSSFYRPPTREQVAKMARRVPASFGFTLKVPRSASHDRSPDDLPAFKLAVDHLNTLGKLLGLILQVPESFRNTADNRRWLAQTGAELKPHRVAVEFRHRSWDAPNLSEWMEHIGMDVVSVGVPDIRTLFPRGLRVANRRVYARLHSENADNWYEDGQQRYNYDYPEKALREWADGLKRIAEENRADEALVFFNNCVGTRATSLESASGDHGGRVRDNVRLIPNAIANARRFATILKETAPTVRVAEQSAPRQASLFEDDL